MQVTTREQDGISIVTVNGRIDSSVADKLGNVLQSQIHAGKINIVVDLAQVDFASSAAIHVLTGAIRDARARSGDVRLAGTQKEVRRIFSMSGLTMIAEFYPDAVSAVASFNSN